MRRVFLVVCCVVLIAASPEDVLSDLEANGYYIEPGSSATEQVVSDAVFAGRSDGGRLYIVVLSEEPPGGATTFADSVLDDLGEGYVVAVAPETVGFAGDGSYWSSTQMNSAIESSLDGASDNDVVQLFVNDLTGEGPAPSGDEGEPASDTGTGLGWIWLILIIGGVGFAIFMSRRSSKTRTERARVELEKVKALAREKLADIANDIIEMEDEVRLSDSGEVKSHYQRASTTYTTTLQRVEASPTPQEMVEVIRQLDTAIWELDAAEALLDGKPVPEKPQPPEAAPDSPEPPAEAERRETRRSEEDFGRRPERRSSYSGTDLMSALWALIAMSGRGGGGWGLPGGFGGPMRTGSRGPRMGRGGSRMGGGGRRMGGGGRMRGGGRRG